MLFAEKRITITKYSKKSENRLPQEKFVRFPSWLIFRPIAYWNQASTATSAMSALTTDE